MRLDKEKMQVMETVQQYAAKVEIFRMESENLKLEASRLAFDGQKFLHAADVLAEKQKAELSVILEKVNSQYNNLSSTGSQYLSEIAERKVQLDSIVFNIQNSLRGLAYEKMGVEMVREDMRTREALLRKDIESVQSEIRRNNELMEESKPTTKAIFPYTSRGSIFATSTFAGVCVGGGVQL